MKERVYEEVNLSTIVPNPWNPRKNFSGPKFEEMVNSIRSRGVIEPILLRPIENGKLQIIAGERRYRASCEAAKENGGVSLVRIPAIIQEMTEDDAFEVMSIENLQREDLTELEEAQSFQSWLDRKGKNALPELAERLSIHPRYIQRRIAVLGLPKPVLKAWEEGKIKYGHCEQLMRLKDHGEIKNYLAEIITPHGYYGELTIPRLKARIDDRAVELSWAKFNTKAEGCLECRHNSDIQKELFGDDHAVKKTRCLDSSCFKKKQEAWLLKNWKKFAKQAGTNGFRFNGVLEYKDYEEFADWRGTSPGEKCSNCPDFVSFVTIPGKMEKKQVCIGDKACYREITRSKAKNRQSGGDGKVGKKSDGPRVAWHGSYFREQFYHDRIPAVLGELNPDHVFILRAALFSVLKSNEDAREQFGKDMKMIREDQDYFHVSIAGIWERITKMDAGALEEEIKKAAIRIVLQSNHYGSMLNLISDHIGISLEGEWRLNGDYLDKKTISEIHEICEKFGIFTDEKALTFMHETLGKKRGKYGACKKDELIRVILESGVDLAGKVPGEIRNIKSRQSGVYDDADVEEDCCRVCGCTEYYACEGGCHWVEVDLCSACADENQKKEAAAG
jgi:ParB family chromosome partitioning protein